MGSARFQSRTGSPGHLAFPLLLRSASREMFQSRTGSPGHLALRDGYGCIVPDLFQSRTGSPAHLARTSITCVDAHRLFSIPTVLPPPFSPPEPNFSDD